jgi:PAS domain S-box-containing protein
MRPTLDYRFKTLRVRKAMSVQGDISGACKPGAGSQIDDRLRYVLDNVVAFVGALTPSGILTDANEPALRAAGLAREDVIGKPFWDCYWWNHDPAVQEALRDAVRRAAAGEKVRYDAEIRVANDERMIIDFQLSPHFGADGQVDELIPSGVDISQHKASERAVRASRDTFQRLVQDSPFGVYAVDADFRLYLVSDGAQKVFENVRPLIGRDFADILRTIWPEPFASEAIGLFRHTLDTGEPYHAPSTVERRQDIGNVESYDWKIERVALPDGRPGVVCHFYDLSEREQHEAALRESEARFRATFENAAVGIAHVAPDGGWLRVNQKLCDIVGYSPEELNCLSFQDITHPEDLNVDLEQVQRVLDGDIDEYDIEKRYIRKDGTAIWIKLTVGCIREDAGAVQYFISVIEDISEQKAAQDQQRLLVNELNHRVKNSLATIQAMASHTMRNAETVEAFREAFTGRLRAIAAAHDSIFDHGAGRAELRALILRQLDVYGAAGSERLALEGPETRLSAAQAHGLGLIVHELATNASKYGALSNEAGKIHIAWSPSVKDGTRLVTINWTESGGPPVSAPTRKGFGSRLIESTLEHSLGGSAAIQYEPEGLHGVLTVPVDETEADE